MYVNNSVGRRGTMCDCKIDIVGSIPTKHNK